MDLDNFKWVNDNKGHAAGDEFLKSVARILRDTFRETDTTARLGGDEFAVLLCGVNADAAAVLAGRLRDSLEWNPLSEKKNGDSPIDIVVEVGSAMYGDDGQTPEALVEAARSSMTRLDDPLPVARDDVA